MKNPIRLGIVFSSIVIACFQPAYGCLEVQGRERVKLPDYGGEKARKMLNQALRNLDRLEPLRVEMIDDGRQTNFELQGVRECAGSVTSHDGFRYIGTNLHSAGQR